MDGSVICGAQGCPGWDSEALGEGPELVECAVQLARTAHRGQRRATDDAPYIVHAIEAAHAMAL